MKWILTDQEQPPKDGTPILIYVGDWSQYIWKAPIVGLWAEFHPNSKGKMCWRAPSGDKIGGKNFEPRMWARLPDPKIGFVSTPLSAAKGDRMKCPHCGQERGESRIAHFRDLGFDPLEHCVFKMLHEEKIEQCIGQSPIIGRQCELCPRSKLYGRWEVSRGKQTFIPTKEEPEDGRE